MNDDNQGKPAPQQITFLPQHGHYRHLRVYQVTEIIYDITFYFAHHYLSKGDRTVDQMVQSARSGKQNIAEGNQAAATSGETEIKLTNVAKASLEELLDDYEDYLGNRQPVHHPHPPGHLHAIQITGDDARPLCERRRHQGTDVSEQSELSE